jgi:hypothetical protein
MAGVVTLSDQCRFGATHRLSGIVVDEAYGWHQLSLWVAPVEVDP